MQATYGLWLALNATREGKITAPPHEIMHTVISHMAEWKAVHHGALREPKRTESQRWMPPDEGWVKVNSDGAIPKYGQKGGGGAVLRDHNGGFLAAACHFFTNVVEPEASEILACKRGLQVAAELNATRVHVELDAQGVVNMLQQSSKNLSAVGPWVQEIKTILFAESKISWASRSANVAAHKLAKVGVGDELCKVWLGVPPDFVLDVISDDIPSFDV